VKGVHADDGRARPPFSQNPECVTGSAANLEKQSAMSRWSAASERRRENVVTAHKPEVGVFGRSEPRKIVGIVMSRSVRHERLRARDETRTRRD
jgi:hypothetical protein